MNVRRRVPAIKSLAAACVLTACAAIGPPAAGPPIPVDGRTLLDDYVIAHGFAAGRVLSSDADRKTVLAIVQLDRDALLALSQSAANPTSARAAAHARDAIASLTSFVARSSVPEGRS